MNYEVKRLKLLALLTKAEDNADWYEVKTIKNVISRADNVAKVDIRHANGILDRLLKSEYCMCLMSEEDKDE